MAAIADGLAERGVATLRYQFPYMEKGGKRVDPPPVAHAAVRAAVAEARRAGARIAAVRRRPLVRRADDLAGPGAGAAGGRARPGLLRLPAAPRRQALDRARRPPRRRADPDAVPAGDQGHAGRARAAAARRRRSRRARDAGALRRRRPLVPRPRQDRPQGRRGAGARSSTRPPPGWRPTDPRNGSSR